jgi:hypothetical protein
MDNVLRWDCGPGCGTTGCGNDPESLRRYEEYRRTGQISRKPLIGEPGWQPSSSEPPKKDPWWKRLLLAIFGGLY